MHKELGQRWLLLRGLTRESGHWGDFIPHLQATFPEAEIITLDLPGTGSAYREASPSSIKGITEQIRSRAYAHGLLQQPITILALSLGAMVAWEWMLSYPQDLCGAILINTSFANLSPFYQRLRWQSYKDFLALMLTRNLKDRETKILQLVSNFKGEDTELIEDWYRLQNSRPVSSINSYRQIVAAATYKTGETKPTLPILLLCSRGDRLVSPNCSETIQKKWHLELCCHETAGHDLSLDDDAWVLSQLVNWLSQNMGKAALS
jgi:pimeloyl-ACP methyl ester carboxylesterase